MLADRFAHGGPLLTTAERAAADRAWTYGHIVVDEAQELSAMAWRMLVRRCPTRSMTIAGDVAQTSTAAGAHSWRRMLDPVLRDSWRLAELTVNYRTPSDVAEAAQRVATRAGLPVSPLTSAREVPEALVVRRVTDLATDVPTEVAAALAEVVGTAAALPGDDPGAGRVAVLAANDQVGDVRQMLAERFAAELTPPAAGSVLDARLAVLTPRDAKGLEFDVVVLVEPGRVAAESVGDLYVAMTRPTRALRVVAARDLPEGIV